MEIAQKNRQWLDDLALDHPVVIAGPCSAETEEQVLNIAHSLKVLMCHSSVQVSGSLVPAPVCLRAWEL